MAVSHHMSQRSFHPRRTHVPLGIHLIAGAVGILAGLKHLLSTKAKIRSASDPVQPRPEAVQNLDELPERKRDFFSIRRTKSELGYVYWVLQGYGEFQCFVLYDTWREAVDEASRRVSDSRA